MAAITAHAGLSSLSLTRAHFHRNRNDTVSSNTHSRPLHGTIWGIPRVRGLGEAIIVGLVLLALALAMSFAA